MSPGPSATFPRAAEAFAAGTVFGGLLAVLGHAGVWLGHDHLTGTGVAAPGPQPQIDLSHFLVLAAFWVAFAGVVTLVGGLPAWRVLRRSGRTSAAHAAALLGGLWGVAALAFLALEWDGGAGELVVTAAVVGGAGALTGALMWRMAYGGRR